MPGAFQHLVLWATIGLLLNAVGWGLTDWQFWCFMGLFWSVSQLGRMWGKGEGVVAFLELTEVEQNRIKRALKEIKEKSNG